MDTISEQVATNSEQITSLHDNVEIVKNDICGIKDDVEVIKLDLRSIKNDLKQKVSREEFIVLEKQVSLLGTKANH